MGYIVRAILEQQINKLKAELAESTSEHTLAYGTGGFGTGAFDFEKHFFNFVVFLTLYVCQFSLS